MSPTTTKFALLGVGIAIFILILQINKSSVSETPIPTQAFRVATVSPTPEALKLPQVSPMESPFPTPVSTSTPTPSPAVTPTTPPSPSPSPSLSPLPTESPTAQTHEIIILSSGFEPSQLTINKGDTVRFINKDDSPHWPASGIHPVHQLCPGFDALKGLSTNETYEFTFTEAKGCPMHDHLNPSVSGKITVQ